MRGSCVRAFSGGDGSRFGVAVEWHQQRSGARQGIAKIRKAIAVPAEALGMDVAIIPAMFAAGFGVIHDPIFCLAKRFNEGAMADAPDLVSLLEYGTMFGPGIWIENVIGFVVQEAEAVIGGPATAGGIDDKDVSVAPQNLRAFADGHGNAFPGLIGSGDSNSGP